MNKQPWLIAEKKEAETNHPVSLKKPEQKNDSPRTTERDARIMLEQMRRQEKKTERKMREGAIRHKAAPQDKIFSKNNLEEPKTQAEEALDAYLQTGTVEKEMLCDMIAGRKLFPCYFGSALKNFGVEEFFSGICQYTKAKKYPDEFGARVFKITRDPSGLRLTHLKITGGKLKARELIRDRKGSWEEKVNQIRIYSGEKYESASEAYSGEICAVTGLTYAYAGEGLGVEEDTFSPLLEPVLTYRIELPEDCDAVRILPKLRQLEEEDPKLHILWNETHQELLAQVMGEVQMEILKRQALDR